MRAWRNSNAAVCQSAVPGAIPGARTIFGAVVFNSQHSGLLIRTVRVRVPPAPLAFASLREDGGYPPKPWRRRAAVTEDGGRRSLPAPSDLSRGINFSRALGEQPSGSPQNCPTPVQVRHARPSFWGCGRPARHLPCKQTHVGATPTVSTNLMPGAVPVDRL